MTAGRSTCPQLSLGPRSRHHARVVAGRHPDRVRIEPRRKLRDLRDGRRRLERDTSHERRRRGHSTQLVTRRSLDRIAERDFGVQKIRPDGTGLAAVSGGTEPAWSPDGTRIAVRAGQRVLLGESGWQRRRHPDVPAPGSGCNWREGPIGSRFRSSTYGPGVRRRCVSRSCRRMSECVTPDRVHGPPLDDASCGAPAQTSDHLTVGTLDANGVAPNFSGVARYDVLLPGFDKQAYNADMQVAMNVKDVRNAGNLTDYTGELQLDVTLRVTDKDNASAPTAQRTGHRVGSSPSRSTVPCAATADPDAGATCAVRHHRRHARAEHGQGA